MFNLLYLAAYGMQVAPSQSSAAGTLNLLKVFQSAPWIYSILFILSTAALAIGIYSLFTLREKKMMPEEFIQQIRGLLSEKRYETALSLCQQNNHFSSKVLSCAVYAHNGGAQAMIETMEAQGRRSSNSLWQQVSILNEIAFISPMLGLLGTVLGLFFAFYDSSQSSESLAGIFDGLGIAIGTTVAGLIVAILAMSLSSIIRFRIVGLMNTIETELLSLLSPLDLEFSKKERS